MGTDSGDRTKYWPAIEKKYGHDMAHWFEAMKAVEGQGYVDQMAFLQEQHGFTRAHANALVMYTRGSASSKRFEGVDGYLDGVADPAVRATVRAVLESIEASYPELGVVISWNRRCSRPVTPTCSPCRGRRPMCYSRRGALRCSPPSGRASRRPASR